MSVDIENSTRLKRKKTWFDSVAGFLFGFGAHFTRTLGKKDPDVQKPNLWKALGDELVFFAEVSHLKDVRSYISALKEAIHLHNTDSKKYTPTVKCSAWLAEFPFSNMVLPLTGGEESAHDFIGPQMDVGFRLARFATARKMVVSLELAWVLEHRDVDFSLFWDGLQAVKGLVEGPGYPVIWIDTDGSGRLARRDRDYGRHSCDRSTLLDHCAKLSASRSLKGHVFLPAILDGRIQARRMTQKQAKQVRLRYQTILAVEPANEPGGRRSINLPPPKKIAASKLAPKP